MAGWVGTIAHNKAVELALKESTRRKRIVAGSRRARLPAPWLSFDI